LEVSNLGVLHDAPARLVEVFNDYRGRRARIERDPDLTVAERKRATSDLATATQRRLDEVVHQAMAAAGHLQQDSALAEGAETFSDSAEADRRWHRLERLLDSGLTVDDVLTRHVKDRADVAALEANLPAYLESAVAATGKGNRADAVRSMGPKIAEALQAVRDRELDLVSPRLRSAREEMAAANHAAESITAHLSLINREVAGGRAIDTKEMIALGMGDPTTAEATKAGRAVPKPDLPPQEPSASGWQMRAMLLEEGRQRAADLERDRPLVIGGDGG